MNNKTGTGGRLNITKPSYRYKNFYYKCENSLATLLCLQWKIINLDRRFNNEAWCCLMSIYMSMFQNIWSRRVIDDLEEKKIWLYSFKLGRVVLNYMTPGFRISAYWKMATRPQRYTKKFVLLNTYSSCKLFWIILRYLTIFKWECIVSDGILIGRLQAAFIQDNETRLSAGLMGESTPCAHW